MTFILVMAGLLLLVDGVYYLTLHGKRYQVDLSRDTAPIKRQRTTKVASMSTKVASMSKKRIPRNILLDYIKSM